MAKTKSYEVEMAHTTGSGAKKTMWRAGRQFEVKVPQVLDLTKEEVEAFENDKRFSIKEATDAPEQTDTSSETSDSESDAQDSGDAGDETSEEDATTEDSDSEDSSSDEAEEASDDSTEEQDSTEEDAVAVLVRDNGRTALNAKAIELGVTDPENMKDKTEVAQAIVDAEARNSNSEATS